MIGSYLPVMLAQAVPTRFDVGAAWMFIDALLTIAVGALAFASDPEARSLLLDRARRLVKKGI